MMYMIRALPRSIPKLLIQQQKTIKNDTKLQNSNERDCRFYTYNQLVLMNLNDLGMFSLPRQIAKPSTKINKNEFVFEDVTKRTCHFYM